MEMGELSKFIEEISDKLSDHYNQTEMEQKYRAALKVAEESGELVGEALKHLGLQRKEKLDSMKEDGLGKEMADVIITTMIMAKRFDVDIQKAMEKKMQIIKERFELE